jgi:hypothetical protein
MYFLRQIELSSYAALIGALQFGSGQRVVSTIICILIDCHALLLFKIVKIGR